MPGIAGPLCGMRWKLRGAQLWARNHRCCLARPANSASSGTTTEVDPPARAPRKIAISGAAPKPGQEVDPLASVPAPKAEPALLLLGGASPEIGSQPFEPGSVVKGSAIDQVLLFRIIDGLQLAGSRLATALPDCQGPDPVHHIWLSAPGAHFKRPVPKSLRVDALQIVTESTLNRIGSGSCKVLDHH